MSSTPEVSSTKIAQPKSITQERRGMLSALGLMHELDVLVLLNVKLETMRVWRAEKRGPSYVKLGREVCYKVTDLIAWTNANYVDLAAAPLPDASLPEAANDDAEPELDFAALA